MLLKDYLKQNLEKSNLELYIKIQNMELLKYIAKKEKLDYKELCKKYLHLQYVGPVKPQEDVDDPSPALTPRPLPKIPLPPPPRKQTPRPVVPPAQQRYMPPDMPTFKGRQRITQQRLPQEWFDAEEKKLQLGTQLYRTDVFGLDTDEGQFFKTVKDKKTGKFILKKHKGEGLTLKRGSKGNYSNVKKFVDDNKAIIGDEKVKFIKETIDEMNIQQAIQHQIDTASKKPVAVSWQELPDR